MSFSSEVKKELSKINSDDCCIKAELYGIIKYKSTLKLSQAGLGLEMITTSNVVARRIVQLFKKVYNSMIEIYAVKRTKLDYKTKYVININNDCFDILKDLKIMNDDYSLNEQINYDILKKECCKSALVRGLFLAQGSVNNPETDNYHLEVTLNNLEDVKYITEILSTVNIFPKMIERSKGYVLYLKKSEQIGDFLNFVGAVNSMFQFEDKRIKKDYNNYVNRIINCDIANEQKAMNTAKLQLENIKFLTENQGLVSLTQRLTDAVLLRTTYPDYSLSELSSVSEEVIGKFISKSGLSHCFKDIAILCEEIKGKK